MNATLPRTPPSAWYSAAEHARAERETVFARAWHPVARLDQLDGRGRFVTADLAGEPVVVVRGDDLRAFYNVCRHHAAAVVTEAEGCARRLRCPYHGWSYGLDGKLLGAPHMDGTPGFEPDAHGLVPLRVDTWGPWAWVCQEPATPPLAEYLAGFAEALAPVDLTALRFHARRSYEMDCNWKVFVDNYLDGGYHVPFIHRGLTAVLDNRHYAIDCGERHVLQRCPVVPSPGEAGRSRAAGEAHYAWLYPNFMVNVYAGVMDTHQVLPLGPRRCRVLFDFFFEDVGETARERNDDYVRTAHQVQLEDMAISEAVQRGLESRAYDTGPLCAAKEAGEVLFHALLRRDLAAV